MKTISQMEQDLIELDLIGKETRGEKRTNELTEDDIDKMKVLGKLRKAVYDVRYDLFNSRGVDILKIDSVSSVCILNDGDRKYIGVVDDECMDVTSYKEITDDQYNAFMQ
jgi:hypothetical protein